MPEFTPKLNLYLPGGGSSGLITPDETFDIDKINDNMRKIDTAVGSLTDAAALVVPAFRAQGQTATGWQDTMPNNSLFTPTKYADPLINRGFTSWANGALTIARAGVYNVGAYADIGVSTQGIIQVTADGNSYDAAYNDGGSPSPTALSIPLQPGAVIRPRFFQGSGSSQQIPRIAGRLGFYAVWAAELS